MYLLWMFIKRGYLRHVSYRLAFTLGVLNFFFGVVSYFYLSRLIQSGNTRLLAEFGNNVAAFIVVGMTFNTFFSTALRAFSGQIQNDQNVGVLEHLLMSRIGLTRLALYSAVFDFLWSSLLAVASLVLLATAFGVSFSVNGPALAVFLLMVLGLAGLGLIAAGVILVVKQGDPVAWTLALVTGLLSGVYYPLEVLPDWLRTVGYALPTTYGLRAMRHALINDASFGGISGDLLVVATFAVLSVPLGVWAFHAGFHRARREGTLSHY